MAAAFFLAVAGLVTWPLLPNAADHLRDAGDPALFVWTLHWLATAATQDPGQLYAGPIFHGFPNPVTYTDTSLLPGLLLAPLWLSDNRVLFFNLLMWVTLAFDGFAAYMLVRALTGSALAGVIGGLVCAVNSYMLAHLSHLNLLSAYWLPVGLLALHRLCHPGSQGPGRHAALVLALALVGQALSTFYVLAYLLIAVGLYLAWQALARRAVWQWPAAWRRRWAGQLLIAFLVTGATIALITAPYWETQQVMGFARSRAENLTWSAQPLDYFSVSPHNHIYARLLPRNNVEPLFAGFAALSLAAIGVLAAVRKRRMGPAALAAGPDPEAGFYALLLLTGVVLSFGPVLNPGELALPMPYQLLALLPGATALRAPVRAMVLVNLSLGVFAGLGLKQVLDLRLWAALRARLGIVESGTARPKESMARAGIRALGGVLLAGLIAVMLIEQQIAPLALAALPANASTIPAAYRWLAAHRDGGVLSEMPISLGLRDITVASTHMYYQTWHGHPLVEGYSGFLPPTYVEILARFDAGYTAFTPEQLGILQSLDVRYILYHSANFKTRAWQQLAATLAQFPQVHAIGAFPSGQLGDDYLYMLDPRPADAVLRITITPYPAVSGRALVQIANPYPYPLLSRLRPTLDLLAADGHRLSVHTPITLPPGIQNFAVPLDSALPDPATSWTPQAPAPAYLEVTPPLAGAR